MINKVTLVGHAGNDPEVRTLETGAVVARVSLATNESYKDKEGNWQTSTEWHNLILWRDLAERAQDNVKKGSTLYVEGKISSRKYTDKDGVEKSITDIVVASFRVLDKKERSEDSRIPRSEPRNMDSAGKDYQDAETAAHQDPSDKDGLPF
jgi:single-strand DNA-binding protein